MNSGNRKRRPDIGAIENTASRWCFRTAPYVIPQSVSALFEITERSLNLAQFSGITYLKSRYAHHTRVLTGNAVGLSHRGDRVGGYGGNGDEERCAI
jgi:hypothetical protein